MVAPIYFTAPDDLARGHLVGLKDKWFGLDESKRSVPSHLVRMRLRDVLLQDGIDKAGVIMILIGFNRFAPSVALQWYLQLFWDEKSRSVRVLYHE